MSIENNKKIPVIMIVGDGHSGSTLLDLILDSHSKIVGVGELSHYSKYLNSKKGVCSCGSRIVDCSFWQDVFDGIDYSKFQRFYRPTVQFLLNIKKDFYIGSSKKIINILENIRIMEKVYSRILIYSKKKIIVDSSKSFDRAEALIHHSNNLDILLVHLVRDGRGVTYSNIRIGRSPIFFIKKWGLVNLKIEIIKKRNNNIKKIFILYEDFVENPKIVLEYILNQVDLHFEDGMLNFRDKVHHQPSGNLNLRITTKNKSSRIEKDKKWEKEMSIKDKIVFNFLFGWLNLFYKLKSKKY